MCNASVIKTYNATGSQVRFGNKTNFFYFEKLSSLLQRWRCCCKFRSRRIGSWELIRCKKAVDVCSIEPLSEANKNKEPLACAHSVRPTKKLVDPFWRENPSLLQEKEKRFVGNVATLSLRL
jgi:hypothetical protein